jgi:hypothetical protein
MAAAIISVLVIAVIWRQSSRPGVGRGSPPGRALARILLVLIVLLLIGFVNPSVAGNLVSGFLGGIKTAATGLADFFGQIFH